MLPGTVILHGTLKPDGTLELNGAVPLPPGKVQVIVQPLPELPPDDPFWQMMQEIWAGQEARGHLPRTVDEVEAERHQVREDWDERMQQIERLQAEGRSRAETGP